MSRRRRRVAALAALAVAVAALAAAALAPTASRPARAPTVYAAASLRGALPAIDRRARYSFAGSDRLRLQIERGAPADVFASASPDEARALFREGRCARPVTFATNALVLIVPRGDPGRVRSVQGLRSGRRRLAIGAPGVPIGAYTRTLLARLRLRSVLAASTVSGEPSVASIVAKVALRSADAGFVYRTDARAARGRVRAIALPRGAQPPVRYALCAVRRPGADALAARTFIRAVTSERGRSVLRRQGFGPPPRG